MPSEAQRKKDHERYLRTKDARLARNKEKTVVIKARVRKWKEERPCTDCGRFYPFYVMEFDHHTNGNKILKISAIQYYLNWERIEEEIAKCDLVCSNCHRERTHKRGYRRPSKAGLWPNARKAV